MSERLSSIEIAAFENCEALLSISIPESVTSIASNAFYGCNGLTKVSIFSDAGCRGAFRGMESIKTLYIGPSVREIKSPTTALQVTAFSGCSNLTKLTICKGVKIVGNGAFSGCISLTSVILPEGVETVGSSAFSGCVELKKVSLPSTLVDIKENTFKECNKLESVEINSNIGCLAFKNNTSIKEITFGNTVSEIKNPKGGSLFVGFSNLTSLIIPNSVQLIGDYAFAYCENLKDVQIGHSVKTISWCAFAFTGIESVSLPSCMKSIDPGAFMDCKYLKTINLNNIETIGDYAFKRCESLTNISLSNKNLIIGNEAFADCTSLRTVKLGNSLALIDSKAFDNDPIETIMCWAPAPPFCRSKFSNEVLKNAKLYVPYGSLDLYRNETNWKDFFIEPLMQVTAQHGFTEEVYDAIEMEGVTADGLSQLRISQPEKSGKSLAGAEVRFEVNGVPCLDSDITGTCIIQGEDAIYTAPEDYSSLYKDNCYTVDILFVKQSNGLATTIGKSSIRVYRPGVLLVHGFNSDASCFAKVKNYLTSIGGYKDSQIRNVNYFASNKAKFDYNTKIIKNNAKELFRQLADEGIVSSSYDMIGHSMGGILIRKYAQEVDKNSVNKIITVNTPHSGSPWADAYLKMVSRVDDKMKNSDGLIGDLWFLGRLCATIKKKYGNWGAIDDLSTSSKAIEKLNNPKALEIVKDIPVQALYSTLNMENAVPQKVIKIDPKYSLLYDTFTVGTFLEKDKDAEINDVEILNRLFVKEKHDGVVPLNSQCGGLTGIDLSPEGDEYKGAFGFSSYSHHCNITDNPETFSEIQKLLYSPKNSGSFVKGFKPLDLSKKSANTRASDETVTFKNPSESQFIKILPEKEDTARILKVMVTGSDDLWTNLVFIDFDEGNLLTGIGQNEYRFRIPDTYEGDLTVYALGRTEDDALVGDSIVVNYEKEASLNYLYFEDWPKITMVEGQQIELNVIGGWSNGDENYIIPDYSTNKEGVLELDGSLITAKSEGECLLIANYDGLADTITVKVLGTNTNSISTIERNKPSIRYNNGSLKVILENDYIGPIKVIIYDMSGNICYQQHRMVSVQANEPIAFDLSSLSSQLYIARVRTTDEYAIKFVKK